jgi:hypothetical protein
MMMAFIMGGREKMTGLTGIKKELLLHLIY